MVWKLNIYVIYFILVTFCCLVLSPINTASVKSIIQLLKSRGPRISVFLEQHEAMCFSHVWSSNRVILET